MRIWFDTQRLTSLNLSPSDVVNAIQAQNVQAPVGRIGARPIEQRPAVPDERADAGAADDAGTVRQHRAARQSRRLGAACQRRRAGRDGRAERGRRHAPQRSAPPSAWRSTCRPAPMRCRRRRASIRRWPSCRQRFPPGLKYNVVYDSTVFVADTIHEVLKTLAEAFVLVVIVVFLFLGNLRATIIPAVAVPVSLIGTFAVLLAMGYSANTVSLLAMVLAIGIVVDDAIVVVENVERVLEEEPELTPADGDDEGDEPDHRADHRHHPGAAVGVRAGRLHPGHLRPTVPPVRGHDQRRHADLGPQRADAVAGALCAGAAPRGEAPRPDGAGAARHRSTCATAMRGRCGGWCASPFSRRC